MDVQIFRDVDVLVVGSSTGAVAAALQVQQAGKSAMLLSDMSYLGEETAGTLNLWTPDIERGDPVVAAMFHGQPPMPAAVKHALDLAVVKAAIPLMYLARPVALLRDGSGSLQGAVVAARTSLFAVTCRKIIDATRHGVVARLAGAALQPRADFPGRYTWTILADELPAALADRAEELSPPFKRPVKDEGERTFRAFRIAFDRAAIGSDPRTVEHLARAAAVMDKLLYTADIIATTPEQQLPGSLAASVPSIADAQLTAAPDILTTSHLLPLTPTALLSLERADVQAALGRRVGNIAAAAGAARRTTDLHAVTGGNSTGDFRFAPAFLRNADQTISLSPLAFPTIGTCDVAVAGGGTGGAPAGIAAARAGAKTIVIEMQHALGGVGTLGLISNYWFGNKVGFTAELDSAVVATDIHAAKKKGAGWTPEIKAGIYHRMLRDAGGTAWLGSYAFGVRMHGARVSGLLVSTPLGCGLLEAGCVVDATGNADIPAAAGAPCRVIDARHVATQGTGLSPRNHPANKYQNSDHTFIDETDPEGISHAFINARAKFAAEFDTSPLVDSRERRQIIGEYEISPLDIMAGRTFPDTVVTASSNFDTHGFIVHPLFMVAAPDHKPAQAHVPYRCMLPRGIDGVLVTGLGMSAHRDALPVIRMQADVQNQGFAAGIAAAESASTRRKLRDVDVRVLQRQLTEIGILAKEVPAHTDSFPMSDAAIAAAAEGDVTAVMNVAILLSHPQQSEPLLLQAFRTTTDAERKLHIAVLLGMLANRAAAPVLADAIRARTWDEGWNYRGMGQFGASMSPLDTMIVALARTGDESAVEVIEEKIRQLSETSEFSHCRVVGLAAAQLKSPRLARAIYDLLQKPGMQGHAHLRSADVIATANADPCETQARNDSLRELSLARGLYLAGDIDGLGQRILQTYTRDLRGHYARHAQAVLAHPDVPALELA